ncbi:MAG: hypothetical protein RI909_64 [Bacteroidota bacterium]
MVIKIVTMKSLTLLAFMMIMDWHIAIAQAPEYIFVFLNNKPDKAKLADEEVKKIMDGHMANIGRLAKEGKLISAGPFDGGGGIFIFKSGSIDQVREWLKTDPGVQANRWNLEVLPYYPQYGSVCAAKEPYQMVTYQFIRYAPNITKDNINQQTDLIKKHHDYLKEQRSSTTVITEGVFGTTDGGILIVNGEMTNEVIENDPAVRQGFLAAEIKKLWIAKGAFCEK